MDCYPSSAQVPSAEIGTAIKPNEILPRSPHRRRKTHADRGLPADEELMQLAQIYLEQQRKNWPAIAKAGLLPAPAAPVLQIMVEDYKARHRASIIDPHATDTFLSHTKKFGGNYNRYSCDNSDPKSIADQMAKALARAAEDGRFIPWCYVFCDYSVSGLDASRQGYASYKKVLGNPRQNIDTTYIDDFTRASRDELEWWTLAAFSKRLRKRLIGASDNFDLDDPDWEMKLTMYGLLSRLFIKSLRQKVKRGMGGTHRNGGTLGRPPLGYSRSVKRDESGLIQHGPDGAPKTEICFDPETQAIVLEIFEMFVNRRWTTHRIAKDLNRRKVNGWDGWTSGGLLKILRNPAYVGVFIWNRTRREFDIETRKWKVVENPRKDRITFYNPELQFVPAELWKAARRRLASTMHKRNSEILGETGDQQKTTVRPTASTLFSDILVCGYCQRPLRLYRSTSKFRDLHCPNGPIGNHGCKLTTSKSVRIVEECLLRYIQDAILTENNLAKLVEKANGYLAEEAAKPREDLRPLKEKAKQLSKSIAKLVERVEQTEKKEFADGYDRRIKELQRQLNDLRNDIRSREQDKGDVALGVDLSLARFDQIDNAHCTALLILPPPQASCARVDHDRSRLFALTSDGLWAMTPGTRDYLAVVDKVMAQAQDLVASAASNNDADERPQRSGVVKSADL